MIEEILEIQAASIVLRDILDILDGTQPPSMLSNKDLLHLVAAVRNAGMALDDLQQHILDEVLRRLNRKSTEQEDAQR